jgi:hypothetical protein
MKLPFLAASVLALLASHAAAQSCSTLGVTWDPLTSTLATALTGAPANAPTMTFAALHQGTTPMMHNLTLGLAMPFYSMYFGVTDANGVLNTARVLTRVPTGITVYFQSVSMNMSRGGGMGGHMNMTFCVSNVAQVAFP